jgi:hypothetical protein
MTEQSFAVALLDRQGNLLGASVIGDLRGEVKLPAGVDLRNEDLRPYLDSRSGSPLGRSFALVSATRIHVKDKPVRLGIYREEGEWIESAELPDIDLAAVAAILDTQASK